MDCVAQEKNKLFMSVEDEDGWYKMEVHVYVRSPGGQHLNIVQEIVFGDVFGVGWECLIWVDFHSFLKLPYIAWFLAVTENKQKIFVQKMSKDQMINYCNKMLIVQWPVSYMYIRALLTSMIFITQLTCSLPYCLKDS